MDVDQSSDQSPWPGEPERSGPPAGSGHVPASGHAAGPGAPSGGPRPRGGAGRGERTPRTVTKKELVARIADRTGQTKVDVKDVIQMFLDEIIAELGRNNRLEFREFGVFEIKTRAARRAQNPRTLEKVEVPAKRVVKFKVGRLMREQVAEMGPPPSGSSDD